MAKSGALKLQFVMQSSRLSLRLSLLVRFSRAVPVGCFLACVLGTHAQPTPAPLSPVHASIDVRVDLSAAHGDFPPVYRWFGYDESNYTTTANGKALLGELHALSPVPVYIRAHFLLASGDGRPELKWSSSNVYTIDAKGNPVYDWTILDGIFDAYAAAHVRPMVELGFMPKDLSTHPDPYHIPWPTKPGEVEGWSFPPKDFARWGELAFRVAQHMAERYGMAEVSTWYWEVWNEPDIFYWRGTEDEYFKLYDFAAAGVRRAIPGARIGGPATTGPLAGSRSAAFLQAFLAHCATGQSSAGGGRVPLDFISFHVKGKPSVIDGHVEMGLDRELENAQTGFAIIRNSAQFARLPVILSEADPEGCAACSAQQHPENAYRNGSLYPTYTAAAMKGLLDLAHRDQINLIGFLTWAFEFENEPYFAGLRDLATNGIDKPELNFFRMAGMLAGERVSAASTGAVPLDSILAAGVRAQPDVDVLATRSAGGAAVMLWNYADDDVPGPGNDVHVTVQGIAPAVSRVLVEQFLIDETHSNAFTAWKQMGSPQQPTAAQIDRLKSAGQLELSTSPEWVASVNGRLALDLHLPAQSVALLRLSWQDR
jgi:xylan 1,4-beta-xylosidase